MTRKYSQVAKYVGPAAACIVASSAATAWAQQTMFIDLGRNDNTTASNYNNVAEAPNLAFGSVDDFPTINDLTNDTGTSTGYSFDLVSVATSTITGMGIGGFNTVPAPNGSTFDNSAAADTMYLLNVGNTASFSLSDLNPAETYTLEMYNFIGGQTRLPSQWTIGGSSQSLDPQNNTATKAVFNSVVPDGSGAIGIDWDVIDDLSGQFAQGHWNAFRIIEDGTGTTAHVDFGRDNNLSGAQYNNVAAAGNAAWNLVADFPTLTDMTDTLLGSTGWDFDLVSLAAPISTGGGPINTGIAGFSAAPSPNNSGFENSAAADSLYIQGSADATFELDGLPTDGTVFDIEVYGYITADRTLMEIEIDGVLQTLEVQNNTDSTVLFSGVLPDVNGKIQITVGAGPDGGGTRQAQLGAIKVTEVPEPASLALASLGALAMLMRRSR